MIRKTYITVGDRQLHARVAGDGPPVMLLHASPLSSEFMLAHIAKLAATHHVIAVDTPGYGNSDPLPQMAPTLDDYADCLLKAATAYGLDSFQLYGTATGAQIALAMAKRAPARIHTLVIDNCAHFNATLRDTWRDSYFADLSPKSDGSHWRTAWDIAAAQFQYFPWHVQSPETALNRAPPPPEFITKMALGFMCAMPAYDTVYRLAFEAEDIGSFDGLIVPTTLIDWQGSIVRPFVQALIDEGLPACVRVAPCGPSLDERLAAIAQAFTPTS
jgi:pimeloyl-ACP methyl ester carboxylesterase